MPKTETQEHAAAARPPRPEPRGRSVARAPGGTSGDAVPGAYSAFRLAPNTTGEGSGADVGRASLAVTALEGDAAEGSAADGSAAEGSAAEADAAEGGSVEASSFEQSAGVLGRVESLSRQSLSRQSEGFGQPRANVLGGLPLASLEGPSMASLDLTPSPVPRVSLVHANGSVDVSLVPGPHVVGSRNLPTVAARHVLGPARARAAAPAITLPPHWAPQTVPERAESHIARKLKAGMRSSKREIVLGLSIGVGLSLVLAGLGQSYVDNQRSWQAQGGIETAKLSALPQPAASTSALADLPEASSPTPRASEPLPAATAEPRGVALPAASDGADEISELEVKPAAPAPKRKGARDKSPKVPKRAAARRVEDPFSDSASLPAKASLSPSESAGLGLDLPL